MQRLLRRFTGNMDVIVVSGLPRSGTSLMMQMLAAAHIEVLTDHVREADHNNPRGYYEYERVKALANGDGDWLKDARGKAVKVVSPLLQYLPPDYSYRVIFMQRDVQEILQSQQRMRDRLGNNSDTLDIDQLRTEYQNHLIQTLTWERRQNHIKLLTVDHHQLLTNPAPPINAVIDFLALPGKHRNAMHAVIDPDLYRERQDQAR